MLCYNHHRWQSNPEPIVKPDHEKDNHHWRRPQDIDRTTLKHVGLHLFETQSEATTLQQKQKTTATVHSGGLDRNRPKRKSPDGNQHVRVRWCRNRE
ncbi:hypothetical protein A2U01_0049271, partial [Trifolium medium]|nr:hypothetical protein [Trifolium medium]